MNTKTATSTVTLTAEDKAVAEKLQARAAEKKVRRIVMPPLMAAF